MRRRSPLALLLLPLALGCAEPEPEPRRPAGAPVHAPGNPQPQLPPQPAPASPDSGPGLQVGGLESVRPAEQWQDSTQGRQATLVYVTEVGRRGSARPAAIIFSSDPTNAHFQRKNRFGRFTVRRLYREEMSILLQDLEEHGLYQVAWEPQDLYADIGPERGFYLYEDQQRQHVLKGRLTLKQKETFTRLEKRVTNLTLAR